MTMDIEPEEKNDDSSLLVASNSMVSDKGPSEKQHSKAKRGPAALALVKALIGDCLCQGAFPYSENHRRGVHTAQFVSLHGIEFIGLGAVVDELTPKERVYDTLEQSKNRTERLISVGYISLVGNQEQTTPASSSDHAKDSGILLETVPLAVWDSTYPNDQSMSKRAKRIISNIKVRLIMHARLNYQLCACKGDILVIVFNRISQSVSTFSTSLYLPDFLIVLGEQFSSSDF